jgi:hypothetical protein
MKIFGSKASSSVYKYKFFWLIFVFQLLMKSISVFFTYIMHKFDEIDPLWNIHSVPRIVALITMRANTGMLAYVHWGV